MLHWCKMMLLKRFGGQNIGLKNRARGGMTVQGFAVMMSLSWNAGDQGLGNM